MVRQQDGWGPREWGNTSWLSPMSCCVFLCASVRADSFGVYVSQYKWIMCSLHLRCAVLQGLGPGVICGCVLGWFPSVGRFPFNSWNGRCLLQHLFHLKGRCRHNKHGSANMLTWEVWKRHDASLIWANRFQGQQDTSPYVEINNMELAATKLKEFADDYTLNTNKPMDLVFFKASPPLSAFVDLVFTVAARGVGMRI